MDPSRRFSLVLVLALVCAPVFGIAAPIVTPGQLPVFDAPGSLAGVRFRALRNQGGQGRVFLGVVDAAGSFGVPGPHYTQNNTGNPWASPGTTHASFAYDLPNDRLTATVGTLTHHFGSFSTQIDSLLPSSPYDEGDLNALRVVIRLGGRHCSLTTGQSCSIDSDCPLGETCITPTLQIDNLMLDGNPLSPSSLAGVAGTFTYWTITNVDLSGAGFVLEGDVVQTGLAGGTESNTIEMLAGHMTLCGNGLVEDANGEQCDDGNVLSGDCCDALCQFEIAGSACASDGNPCTDDACDGAGNCASTANLASCDDGSACTVGDACSGGSCQPGTPLICNDSNPCTDDSCSPVLGCQYDNNAASCSDGDACTTGDVCSGGSCLSGAPTVCAACEVCNSGAGCTPVVELECAEAKPGKSVLVLRDVDDSTRDKLVFRWKGVAPVAGEDFGTPTATTDYELCIYDDKATPGQAETLVYSLSAAHGAKWTLSGSGYRYVDTSASPDGVRLVKLRPGGAGKSRIVLKGKGANLGLVPHNAGVFFSQSDNVTVVLHSSDAECFKSVFPRPWKSNLGDRYRDKD